MDVKGAWRHPMERRIFGLAIFMVTDLWTLLRERLEELNFIFTLMQELGLFVISTPH